MVCTAREICEIALNRDGTVINHGKVIQTLMHGAVPAGCASEYEGRLINFNGLRHVVRKENGEWQFYGVRHGGKGEQRVHSEAHEEVLNSPKPTIRRPSRT